MNVPTFDIFRGSESDARWIESVEGLATAVDRMKILAAEKPGPYFVFHVVSKQMLASIDTETAAAWGRSEGLAVMSVEQLKGSTKPTQSCSNNTEQRPILWKEPI